MALRIGLLLALTSLAAGYVRAEVVTITDTQPIIDFPDCSCSLPLPAELPFAIFDFTGQPRLVNLTSVELVFTMDDGDTAPGELDFNNLSLGLDRVHTSLLFNGFGSGQEPTLTLRMQQGDPNWLTPAMAQTLLEDVYDDRQLFASIVDATPNDNFVNLYSMFDTTIRLTGPTTPGPNPVPEPGSLLVWGLTLGALACGWRRMRV